MTRELAAVHAREGIRVNALCPGPVRTKLLMDFLDTDEKKDRRLSTFVRLLDLSHRAF